MGGRLRTQAKLQRKAAPVAGAAAGGFFAGLAAMTLLLAVFSGPAALVPAKVASTGRATAMAPALPRTDAPTAADAGPASPEAVVAVRDLQARRLEVPLASADRHALPDTRHDAAGRQAAMEFPAPYGTAVVAVEDGTIARLYEGTEGGNGVYQYDPTGAFAYYYAHLDRYADGLAPGQPVKRGQVIGYVGRTGIVPESTPALHFAIFALNEPRRWWDGIAVDPQAVLDPERAD